MQYLCSYKSTHSGLSGLVNVGIRALDRTIYSHSEVSIGNPFLSTVPCISSSGVDGGVRQKDMLLNPERWDILPMPWVTEKAVENWLANNKGKKYDHAGTGRFLLPFCLREHPDKFFCSEAAMAIAGYMQAFRFTPASAHVTVYCRLRDEHHGELVKHMTLGFVNETVFCWSKKYARHGFQS